MCLSLPLSLFLCVCVCACGCVWVCVSQTTPYARIDSLSATRQTCSTFSILFLCLRASSLFDVSLCLREKLFAVGEEEEEVWIHLINDSSRVTIANHDLCVCTEQVTFPFPVHAFSRGYWYPPDDHLALWINRDLLLDYYYCISFVGGNGKVKVLRLDA